MLRCISRRAAKENSFQKNETKRKEKTTNHLGKYKHNRNGK